MESIIERVNEKAICCQQREEKLNKIHLREVPIIENVFEWIKWTRTKKICPECKEFRADSLNAVDEVATEADKDAYLKRYFATE